MTMTNTPDGYEFTEKDLSQIRQTFERTHASTGVSVYFTTGKARGFAAASVGMEDAALGKGQDVVLIQSWSPVEGQIEFGVLAAADRQLITDKHTFSTLLEALVMADAFLRQYLEALMQKRETELPRPDLGANGNDSINSRILSDAEVQHVQAFASNLGKLAGLTGFAKFIESSAGVMSIALGVLDKDTPIMLGTVVVISDSSGTSCTVRDFQNRPMPGLEIYRTLYSALTTTKASFEKLAQLTAKHLRPTLMQRLFG